MKTHVLYLSQFLLTTAASSRLEILSSDNSNVAFQCPSSVASSTITEQQKYKMAKQTAYLDVKSENTLIGVELTDMTMLTQRSMRKVRNSPMFWPICYMISTRFSSMRRDLTLTSNRAYRNNINTLCSFNPWPICRLFLYASATCAHQGTENNSVG